MVGDPEIEKTDFHHNIPTASKHYENIQVSTNSKVKNFGDKVGQREVDFEILIGWNSVAQGTDKRRALLEFPLRNVFHNIKTFSLSNINSKRIWKTSNKATRRQLIEYQQRGSELFVICTKFSDCIERAKIVCVAVNHSK